MATQFYCRNCGKCPKMKQIGKKGKIGIYKCPICGLERRGA